jgi:hypothetical protein
VNAKLVVLRKVKDMEFTKLVAQRAWPAGYGGDGAALRVRAGASLIPPHGEKRVQSQWRFAVCRQIKGSVPMDAVQAEIRGPGRDGQDQSRRLRQITS